MTTHMIYSHERGQWWRPRRHGYTSVLAEAGRYSAQEAAEIIADTVYGWHGGLPPEVAIAATSDLDEAAQRVSDATQAALKAKAND